MRNLCECCTHWKDHENTHPPDTNPLGDCCRYPIWVVRRGNHHCGEHSVTMHELKRRLEE